MHTKCPRVCQKHAAKHLVVDSIACYFVLSAQDGKLVYVY